MNKILPGQTIGIIGGGQLGRMMGLAAKEAGLKTLLVDRYQSDFQNKYPDKVINSLSEIIEKIDFL